jgi:hypothetical protein
MMAFLALSNRFAPFKAAMITYSTDTSGRLINSFIQRTASAP